MNSKNQKISDKILVVDDDEVILAVIEELLHLHNYTTLQARTGEEAVHHASATALAAVIMDIGIPKLNGLEALKKIKEIDPAVPVVIITGNGTMNTAIQAMKLGAFEYLTKPINGKSLLEIIQHAEETRKMQSSSNLKPRLFEKGDSEFELIGNSMPMQQVFKLIGSIASTPNRTSVLISGESGTGKELAARAIHRYSSNAHQPFVAINCTALTETLLESELFGHEKGAFTGAVERKIGKFEFAGEGTIFLDEIGDISPELQKKLLRVLQERQCERLGSNTHVEVKARFIAATNKNLLTEVKEGRFREDLFYRLNVATIVMPPLREREEDIPLIAESFLQKYNTSFNKSIKGFSDSALHFIRSQRFPGNVRELGNIIERAVMMTKGDVINEKHFVESTSESSPTLSVFPIISQNFGEARDYVVKLFEEQFVTAQLTAVNGNVSLAAKNTNMTRQNFQRLMKKYNIQSVEFKQHRQKLP